MSGSNSSPFLVTPCLDNKSPQEADAAVEVYIQRIRTAFAAVEQPRVLWGMSAPDAWDAAEHPASSDKWERSAASDTDGVISFSELPPLPPMQDLSRTAVFLSGVAAQGASGSNLLCCAAEGVTLLKRFAPSDVLGNGFWPSIREGLFLAMHEQGDVALSVASATLLSDMFSSSAASTPGSAAEILAGWLLHRMCSAGGVQQHDARLLPLLDNVEEVWKNAALVVQDTLFVSLCQQPDLWSAALWQELLHGTWPRMAMPQWLLLSGALQRSFASLLSPQQGPLSRQAAQALLLPAASSNVCRDAVAGAAVLMHTEHVERAQAGSGGVALWPSQQQCPPHSSLQPNLAAATKGISSTIQARTQVPSTTPALQAAAEDDALDPWSMTGDPLQGLELLSDGSLADDAAVNGLVRSTDPQWYRGVIRGGQSPTAVGAALQAMLRDAPDDAAAGVLAGLHQLLCDEGGQERELSVNAPPGVYTAGSGAASGASSPHPLGGAPLSRSGSNRSGLK